MPSPESTTDSTTDSPSAGAQLDDAAASRERPPACGEARWRTGSRSPARCDPDPPITWSASSSIATRTAMSRAARFLLVTLHDVLEHAPDREHARVERADAVFEPREIEQVLHDAIEPQRFPLERLEIALARGARPARRRPCAASRRSRASRSAASSARATRRPASDGAGDPIVRSASSRAASSWAMRLKAAATLRDLVAARLRRARRQIAGAEPHGRRLAAPSAGGEPARR